MGNPLRPLCWSSKKAKNPSSANPGRAKEQPHQLLRKGRHQIPCSRSQGCNRSSNCVTKFLESGLNAFMQSTSTASSCFQFSVDKVSPEKKIIGFVRPPHTM